MIYRLLIACLMIAVSLVASTPVPWGGHHEHFIIHVPTPVHHVHHVKKVPVFIKPVKKIHIIEEHHHHEHVHDPWISSSHDEWADWD